MLLPNILPHVECWSSSSAACLAMRVLQHWTTHLDFNTQDAPWTCACTVNFSQMFLISADYGLSIKGTPLPSCVYLCSCFFCFSLSCPVSCSLCFWILPHLIFGLCFWFTFGIICYLIMKLFSAHACLPHPLCVTVTFYSLHTNHY